MTQSKTILTELHGREIGLNHERKLVCKNGYVIEGTPLSGVEFSDEGFLEEVPPVFLQISAGSNQVPADTNATLITYDSTDAQEGGIIEDAGDIVVPIDGVYVILAGAQVGKASGSNLRHLDMWARLNGVDIPRSAVRAGLTNIDSTVLLLNLVKRLDAGDRISFYQRVDNTTGGMGLYATTLVDAPVIPSILVSVFRRR